MRGEAWIRVGVAGLVAAAASRTVVTLPPSTWFDVDPLRSPGAVEGLGPAGSLALDAMLLASAAAVLLGRVCAGRGLDRVAVLLATIPVPFVVWHGAGDLEQIWRGTTLVAAWFAFVAALHLRDLPQERTLLAAGLLAAAVPWLARGAEQWFIEHPQVVAHFEAHRAEVLASFGWAEDGEAARLYERRLRQREMSAWFGLSNVWSAAVAACAVAWTRLAAATRGRGLEHGTIAVAAAIALACVVGVIANGSKGGIAALLAGLAFAWLAPRLGPPSRLALVAIPVGLLAIVARGVLPEGLLGERSLLFRWHYLQGAWRTLLEHPLGVGPAGFQEQYLLVKPVRSPEVVQSAHSMWPDAFTAVGYAAGAWLCLLGRGLWRAPGAIDANPESPALRPLPTLLAATALAVAVGAIAAPASLGVESIGRWVGVVAMPIVGLAGWTILRTVPAGVVSTTLAAAAFTLLLQGQIETTFFNPGATAWALLVVGLAGGAVVPAGGAPADESTPSRPNSPASPARVSAVLLVGVPAALAVAVLIGPLPRALDAERTLAAAASPLEELARGGDAVEQATPEAIVDARRTAIERLERLAVSASPAATRAASLAIEQRILLVATLPGMARRDAALAAVAAADAAVERFGVSPRRLSDRVRALRALRATDPAAVSATRLAEAISAAIETQPQSVPLHLDLAEARLESGDSEAARRAWRWALKLDAALALDPLVQLPEARRREIEARLANGP